MSCSTGRLIVPLSADITTANVSDNNMYDNLIDSFAGLLSYVLADPAYDDDGSLYTSSENNNMKLVCPIKTYDFTPPERLELVEFYNSEISQELYRNRKISIEPLFEIIKDTFGMSDYNKRIVQCKIICVNLCTCVSTGSVLQLCNWNRESKDCEKNALLLGNDLDFIFVNHYAQVSHTHKTPLGVVLIIILHKFSVVPLFPIS